MASKLELSTQAREILEKHGIGEQKTLFVEIMALLAPKKGGATLDLSEITKVDADGKVVEIKCSLSGVWLPANTDNFYPEKDSKIVNAEGETLSRHSRAAYKIKSDFIKTIKASKDAITKDVMDEVITPAEGKAQVAALPTEPDYSVLG